MSEILQSERQGRVLRVTLHRPEKRNALNAALCRELVEVFENANLDPSIGAILLMGSGKAFCAGMDISEISAGTNDEIAEANEKLFTIGARLDIPLIAAVDGGAFGGGVGLLANCHIVLASERAEFGLTEIRLGLWPFLIYRTVTAAIGERRATELSLTGRIIDAREAREIGIVHQVIPNFAVTAMGIAESVANFSPTAVRKGLGFVRETRDIDWKMAGEIGRRTRNEVFAAADFQEGLRAFLEKRSPKWPSIA